MTHRESVHNPILGAMRDDASDFGRNASLPSVQLVRPADAVRVSEVCGACVCLLTLAGCKFCAAFLPVWSAFCDDLKDGEVLMTHCECTRATSAASKELMAASTNPSGHSTFPAVVVCREGEAATVDVDSDCSVKELQLRVLQTLALGMAAHEAHGDDQAVAPSEAYSDDEATPLEALDMEDEADAQAASALEPIVEHVELPDDEVGGDCGCSADGSHDVRPIEEEAGPVKEPVQTTDGVRVTHDVSPDEALTLADGASADRRVCMLYFTNWCGHCQHFKPIWNDCVVQSGRTTGGHLWCAINCESDEGKAAAAREGVRGFPTVHLHHRYREAFGGERSAQALLDFVHRRSLVPALLANYKGKYKGNSASNVQTSLDIDVLKRQILDALVKYYTPLRNMSKTNIKVAINDTQQIGIIEFKEEEKKGEQGFYTEKYFTGNLTIPKETVSPIKISCKITSLHHLEQSMHDDTNILTWYYNEPDKMFIIASNTSDDGKDGHDG